MYRNMLSPNGVLRLKTDNEDLFDYSVETIANNGFSIRKETKDLYSSSYLPEHHGIQTYFEKIFLAQGIKINYLEATLDPLT
jgi:tRNA (guanine-N7-)-methyltransferase